jgi:prolyl oligopeptidase
MAILSRRLMSALVAGAALCLQIGASLAQQTPPVTEAEDPFLWLEDVQGAKALAWVKAHNDSSLRVLEAMPGFDDYRLRAEAALTERSRIAYPRLVDDDRDQDNSGVFGDKVVNFWRDDEHVRGIWREAVLADYLAGKPQWRTLLDLDALSATDRRAWVWKGVSCLAPANNRCLIALSDGGKDAIVIREFDRTSGQFVVDGFTTTEAKTSIAWFDADRVLIGRDFGENSLTDSGYPRQIRLWTRGTALANAPVMATAEAKDVRVIAWSNLDDRAPARAIYRATSFWTGELLHINSRMRLVKGPLPDDAAIKAIAGGRVIALLRSAWTTGGKVRTAGSLVAYRIAPLMAGRTPAIETVYVPPANTAVQSVLADRQQVLISVLTNVSGRVLQARIGKTGWTTRALPLPANSTLTPIATAPGLSLVKAESFLDPERLIAVSASGARTIAAMPPRFDASRYRVQQMFALAKDGTRIPYFVVRAKTRTTPGPTLMFGYGGFEVAKLPQYLTPEIQFWLEDGGTYVLANIRGGGELGPAWHQAGLRENRQTVFNDFTAVAQTLIRTGVTTAPQLGIHGRSNGGLLTAVAMTQQPKLFGAVMIGVPLADMRRYHQLLAGASWMGEFGNPDDPRDWAFIRRYSPYHAIKPGQPYPVPFIYTSTKDDRVHPGHARKFAARLGANGYPLFYYENTEGGHEGVASLKESAYRMALMLVYLNRELRGIGRDSMAAPQAKVNK